MFEWGIVEGYFATAPVLMLLLNKAPVASTTDLSNLTLYGLANYTTFRVVDNTVVALDDHIKRLQTDANTLFGCEPSKVDLIASLREYLALISAQNQIVRMTVFPENNMLAEPCTATELNILVSGRAKSFVASKALTVGVIETTRRAAAVKSTNFWESMLARKKAQLQGFDDALFTNNGLVTEGPAWNIFFVKGRELMTPPARDGLLPGIARRLVLESAASLGMGAQQRSISVRDLSSFDGAFITNCITGLQEVKSVGDMVFKSSGFTAQLREVYEQLRPTEV